MTLHHLAATPASVSFGIFSALIPPVLTVAPGDSVTVETFSGGADEMPNWGFQVPAGLRAIHAANLPRIGPHVLTGPIAVQGAMPGDLLEVRIDAIEIGADWGWCGIFPGLGTLPRDFVARDISFIPVDRAAKTCKLPWGPTIKLRPFFGVMGVAPGPEWGALSSKEPRRHGGNLDNKELIAGASVFLPVYVPGGNFLVGDGHGVQGDGEVCVTALEICLNGRFTFALHKGAGERVLPRAETPTHYIAMGFHESLDEAQRIALRQMIGFICGKTGWSQIEAYKTCSLIVDFHVTQSVNGEKGVHAMLPKGVIF